jgi:hypothetical protein
VCSICLWTVGTAIVKDFLKSTQREIRYMQFLKQAKKIGGLSMVLVCAVGLGHLKVAAIRDRDRLLLPTKFSRHKNAVDSCYYSNLFVYTPAV